MEYSHLEVSAEGNVLRITLNRPDRRNALSLSLLQELGEVLRGVQLREGIDAVTIEGAGPGFSSGHDLGEMVGRDAAFYDTLFAVCTEVMLEIQHVPQPVIAKVHGVAAAAGCQLVAACDLVVAADTARFVTPGVRIGLFCATPMVPISRAIGRKRALEMLLTAEPIDAVTARDWGLVNRVVPEPQLEEEVMNLIGQIAQFSRTVIGIGKHAFYNQIDMTQTAAYEITGPIMAANAARRETQEGISAFLEKRRPSWGN
jgi:enoyl-CoA hydratase/carnithine racemase